MKTPEQHHNDLIEALTYELAHYGPQSLAEIIANLIEVDEDDQTPVGQFHWRVQIGYQELANRLPAGIVVLHERKED